MGRIGKVAYENVGDNERPVFSACVSGHALDDDGEVLSLDDGSKRPLAALGDVSLYAQTRLVGTFRYYHARSGHAGIVVCNVSGPVHESRMTSPARGRALPRFGGNGGVMRAAPPLIEVPHPFPRAGSRTGKAAPSPSDSLPLRKKAAFHRRRLPADPSSCRIPR